MGNNNHTSRLPPIEWEKVDTDNGIQIYRNKANNQLAQKRIITLNQEYDYQDELKIYNLRENNNDALVRILGTQNLSQTIKSNLLCSGQRKIFVYTEKMSHRLSECPQLTFPQCLLFLREALRAFERIYRDYGPVQVTKEMIGINYMGEIKSWLNENWALNHREHEYSNLGSERLQDLSRSQYLSYRGEYMNEEEMVRNIISVVQQKCQEGRFPQAFRQEVQNQSSSFRKLLLYLKDFIEYNDIFLPEKIDYEHLLQIHYLKRFQYQLNNHQSNKHFVTKENNYHTNQGQHLSSPVSSSLSHLNADLTKYMSENPQYSNGNQVNSKLYQLKTPISETNYQLASSDPLRKDTFSKSQFYSSSNYRPQLYSTSNYKQSYHPTTIQSSKYGSSFSSINLPHQQSQRNQYYTNNHFNQGNQYLNNYSNLDNGVSTFKYGGSTYLDENQRNFHIESPFSNYNRGTLVGHQSYLGPMTTASSLTQPNISTVKQQNKVYSISSNAQTGIETKDPLTYEDFKTITDKVIQIDGLTGEKIVSITTKPIAPQNSSLQSNYQGNNIFSYSNQFSTYTTEPITNKQASTLSNSINETYQFHNSSYYHQPLSSQTISTFSFGAKPQQNSIYENAYTGTGYSNTLTKYEPSNNLNKNIGFEGKYVEEFRSLLSPSLQQNLITQQNRLDSKDSKNATVSQEAGKVEQSDEKPGRDLEDSEKQGGQVNKEVIVGFNNIVERASNEVSESILRQF